MKKKIAHILHAIANRLYPYHGSVELVGDYVARDCAIAIGFGKKDINKVKCGCHLSSKQAIHALIKDCLEKNRLGIMNTLKKKKIFEERVYQHEGQTVVETRLKVYVPKEKDKD